MIHITDIGQEQFGFSSLENNSIVDYRHFYTCNLSVPNDYIKSEEELFNLAFDQYGYEDIEFGKRLSDKGLKIMYNDDCPLQHYHPYDVNKFLKRQHSAGSMAVVFKNLHPDIDIPLGIESFDRIYHSSIYIQLNSLFYMLVDVTEIYEQLLLLSQKDSLDISIRFVLSKLYKSLFFIEYQKGQLDKRKIDPLLALNILGSIYGIYNLQDAKNQISYLRSAINKLNTIINYYEKNKMIPELEFQVLSLGIIKPFIRG